MHNHLEIIECVHGDPMWLTGSSLDNTGGLEPGEYAALKGFGYSHNVCES